MIMCYWAFPHDVDVGNMVVALILGLIITIGYIYVLAGVINRVRISIKSSEYRTTKELSILIFEFIVMLVSAAIFLL